VPTPEIVLSGAEVQSNHAYFTVDGKGHIKIVVHGEAAH